MSSSAALINTGQINKLLKYILRLYRKTTMKHLKLNAISLAFATTLISPIAMAETTVYGKGHISVASVDDDNGSSIAVSSHSSRFGVKGSVKKEAGIEVVYKLEWQVDMSDVSKDSSTTTTTIDVIAETADSSTKTSNHIKSRNQYIGVKMAAGEIHLGREDSPYKKAGKKAVEFFSDTFADYNNIVDKGQDVRADDSVSFSTKAGPGKVSLMYAAGDDSTTAENSGDMTSIAYDAKFGAVTLGLSTQTINKSTTNDETGTKVVVGYKLNKATQFGVLFETVSDDLTLDDTNLLISAKHKMGQNAVKFVYGSKDQGLANDATMMAVAYDHKINKSTTAYAIYANGSDNGLQAASSLDGDATVIGGGLVVKF